MTKPTNYSTFPIPARRRAGEAADVNADFMTTGTLLNTPTLYPSAYLVLTSKGYTKHYYAGADRVAASLGGGGLKATGSNPGMQDRAKWLFWESHERVNGRMLQKNDLECIWQGSLPTGEYCKPIDGIPGRMNASVEFYLNDLYDNLKMLAEEQHDEKDVYFYHSDHLGSASWITDGNGIPVQHLQYLPFGEPFVDQHPAGYQERFRFTGKERDEETGYGYFGARYMDHELTAMWLSVDPMADKYPSISPYAYCMWNPVKLVDPDGEDCRIAIDHKKKTITISAKIILYSKSIGMRRLNNIAAQYKKDILGTWSKDKNGKNWTYKGYSVVFDVNVSVDVHAVNPKKRDYQSGDNNYIEVVGAGTGRSHVDNTMNTGMWEEPTKDHDAAQHEFGHLLGLKDQYAEYSKKDKYGRKIICAEPFTGWEGNIMGERDNGNVEQRNIDVIFKGHNVNNMNNYKKRRNDHEK